jgi:hypothetical protein
MVVRNTLWDHCVTLVIWFRRLISINLSHRLGLFVFCFAAEMKV